MSSSKEIVVVCPHCDKPVIIEQLNCRIFRHAILTSNNTQINPHASKEECEYFIKNNLIVGCGKPFKVIENSDGAYQAIDCEYV
jgi:hypothetical protein